MKYCVTVCLSYATLTFTEPIIVAATCRDGYVADNEWMNEWMNESMNEWLNQWKNAAVFATENTAT